MIAVADAVSFLRDADGAKTRVDRTVSAYHNRYGVLDSGTRIFSGWTWTMYPEQWKGFIPTSGPFANWLLSYFEGTPFVVPAYRKASKMYRMPSEAEPKYDGVQIRMFRFPNGRLWGMTKTIEYLERNTSYNKNYQEILDRLGVMPIIEQVVSPGTVLYGHLYGKELHSLRYDFEQAKAVFYDAYDTVADRFLDEGEWSSLVSHTDIPTPIKTVAVQETIHAHGGIVIKDRNSGKVLICEDEPLPGEDDEIAVRIATEGA